MKKLIYSQVTNDLKHIVYNIFGLKLKVKNKKKIVNFKPIDYNKIFSLQVYQKRKIDLIVPVYNGYEYLEDLFNDIFNNTDLEYDLYVVDDCSPDERVFKYLSKLSEKFGSNFHLLQNNENLGFLKTVNYALQQTKNDVVLINTDIRLPKDWASRLMAPIFSNDKVASVTPFSNAATIFSFPIIFKDNEVIHDFNEIDDIFKQLSSEELPLLEFPTGVGFCMAMSRTALNQVGFLNEIYGKGYAEENDWCMSALKKGFINTLATNLFVWHKHGGSFDSEEKIQLCKSHMKILLKRFPKYLSLVKKSSNEPLYKRVRFILLLLYSLKYCSNCYSNLNNSTKGLNFEENDLVLNISQCDCYYKIQFHYKNIIAETEECSMDNIYNLISAINSKSLKQIQ